MAIAFGLNAPRRTICSRFIGTITPAEVARYVTLLHADTALPGGLPHLVDCQDGRLAAGARTAAEIGALADSLSMRFSLVAFVAPNDAALALARQLEDLMQRSSDRCVICGSRDDAWRSLAAPVPA